MYRVRDFDCPTTNKERMNEMAEGITTEFIDVINRVIAKSNSAVCMIDEKENMQNSCYEDMVSSIANKVDLMYINLINEIYMNDAALAHPHLADMIMKTRLITLIANDKFDR